jgi:hypothetical protein
MNYLHILLCYHVQNTNVSILEYNKKKIYIIDHKPTKNFVAQSFTFIIIFALLMLQYCFQHQLSFESKLAVLHHLPHLLVLPQVLPWA